jgi:SAM-dependent methyltransferase
LDYEVFINKQYGQSNLASKLIALLQTESPTREDLTYFDEIHIQGRKATRELASIAELKKGMKVLDIGCGIGGPARTLAAEFGCSVVGLDLNQEFCKTAEILTNLINLNDLVTFQNGNALDMPFSDNIFDVLWIQHVLMNIQDKKQLLKQCSRVLKLGGQLILHEICLGPNSPLHFPVVWANNSKLNYLMFSEDLYNLIIKYGFIEHLWIDITKKSISWYHTMKTTRKSNPRQLLGLDLVIGPDFAKKGTNTRLNLEEGRIKTFQGIFRLIK